jgi:hypothetical protein
VDSLRHLVCSTPGGSGNSAMGSFQ